VHRTSRGRARLRGRTRGGYRGRPRCAASRGRETLSGRSTRDRKERKHHELRHPHRHLSGRRPRPSQGAVPALLGTEPYVDEPYYVGFRLGDQEFGLDPNGHRQGTPGPVTYYHVDDLKDPLGRLRETGASQQSEIRDVGGGKLVVTLTDPDGNVFGLSQEP